MTLTKLHFVTAAALFLGGCNLSLDPTLSISGNTSEPANSGADTNPLVPPNPTLPTEPPPAPPSTSMGTEIAEFFLENPSGLARESQATVAIPFTKGSLTDAQLATKSFYVEFSFGSLQAARYFYNPDGTKHSIKIAFFRYPARFNSGEMGRQEKIFEIAKTSPPQFNDNFFWDSELLSWLQNGFGSQFELVATVGGTEYFSRVANTTPVDRVNESGQIGKIYFSRFTSTSGQVLQGLGGIAWASFAPGQKFFQLTFGAHNSFLNEPISGSGIQLDNLKLRTKRPFYFKFLFPQSQGNLVPNPTPVGDTQEWTLVTNKNIVDGAYFLFRGVGAFLPVGLTTPDGESFSAEATGPLIGIVNTSLWRQRKVSPGATEFMPASPIIPAASQRSTLAVFCNPPAAGFDSDFKFPNTNSNYGVPLNINPPGPGEQPDFAAGVHDVLLSTLNSGSPCPLVSALTLLPRDAQRGQSLYIENRNGINDFMNIENHPELFMYGSRIFGNTQYYGGQPAIFNQRASMSFDLAPFYRPNDNQHMTNEHLIQTYFLTGDFFLFDWNQRYLEINYWSGLTVQQTSSDYWASRVIHSERGTRSFKALLLALDAHPKSPSSVRIRNRMKLRVVESWLPRVLANIQIGLGAAPRAVDIEIPQTLPTPRPPTCLSSPSTSGCLSGWNPTRIPVTGLDPRTFTNFGQAISDAYPDEPFVVTWQLGFTYEMMALMLELGIANPQLKIWMDHYFNSLPAFVQQNPENNGAWEPTHYVLWRNPLLANANPANPIVANFGGIALDWRAGFLVAQNAYEKFYGVPAPHQNLLQHVNRAVTCTIKGNATNLNGVIHFRSRWAAYPQYDLVTNCP